MIEIGTYIRLTNHAFPDHFNKYKEWNHASMSLQFQHVCLWYPTLNCRGEYAKILFDSSISKIVEIENDEHGKPLFVRTNLFWMVFPKALANNEIELLSEKPNEITSF